jgi:hypothetical protein
LPSVTNKLEAERAELDAVLVSGILGKANNLVRLLTFVCEKYFEGETDDIKEYSIAVEALHRSQNFDPQTDTIVRVTAHSLRRRLEEYYRAEGADHAVHICLPAGGYVPIFVRKEELTHNSGGHTAAVVPPNGSISLPEAEAAAVVTPSRDVAETVLPETPTAGARFRRIPVLMGLLLLLLSLVWLGWYLLNHKVEHRIARQVPSAVPLGLGTIRTLIGDGRQPYSDESGSVWERDRFCTGGESFSVPRPAIQGTDDPQLFFGGRRGIFHCKFPLPGGAYEVHLLFAETAGLLENARTIGFSLNGGPSQLVDIVDDAGASDTATRKVFTDVEPQSDGSIHVDFVNADSFLNAVEIVPGVPHHMLPVRIVAGRRSAFRDSTANLWLPDRYYFGGRASKIGNDVSKMPDGGLYEGQRIGHFHYAVPVVPGRQYTVKLYFLERWFGIQNQNVGGVGSRIFDVWCNGTVLLRNFDIMREAGSQTLVKTFPHIEPTAQGKIEIYFKPAVNYPAVSAIEIVPE